MPVPDRQAPMPPLARRGTKILASRCLLFLLLLLLTAGFGEAATVTPFAGPGGSIEPSTPQTVSLFGSLSFTLTPDFGHRLASVGGTCGGSLNANVFTTLPLRGDCTLQANFVPESYPITLTAAAGGSISAPASFTFGSMPVITITPDPGHHIAGVTVNGIPVGAVTSYTLPADTAGPVTVTAAFSLTSFTVTPVVGAPGGRLNPATPQAIDFDGMAAFLLIPDIGHHLAGVGGTCGGTLDSNVFFTLPIRDDCTVQADFAPDSYQVTLTPGLGGTISGPASFTFGSMPVFTVTPDPGYHVAEVTLDGASIGAVTSYVLPADVARPVTLSAVFSLSSFTVTPSAGSGGVIEPSGPQAVSPLASATFTITPEIGHRLASVDGTCGGSLNGNVFSTLPIRDDCTVQANFALESYPITITTAGAGTVAGPAGYTYGSTPVFTITPEPGHHIAGVTVNGSPVGAVTSFILPADALGPVALAAIFDPDPTPATTVSPSFLDFAAGPASALLTLGNSGTAPLAIAGLIFAGSHPGDFLHSGGTCPASQPLVLPPGESCTLEVTFAPSEAGGREGLLRLHTDDPQHPTVDIVLSGTALPSQIPSPRITSLPDAVDFGGVTVGAASLREVIVVNDGTRDLEIVSVILGGAAPGDFSIERNGCSGQTLAPGESCRVEAVLAPAAAGSRSAEMAIRSSDPLTPVLTIPLAGTGIQPPPSTYRISATAGHGGGISPSGDLTCQAGETVTFEIRPIFGYSVKNVLVDGVSVGPVTSFSFGSVWEDHTIQALFAPPDGRLAPGSAEGGISIADAAILIGIAMGDLEPTADHLSHGDVAPLLNGMPAPDGRIDLGDVVVLLRRLVGLTTW